MHSSLTVSTVVSSSNSCTCCEKIDFFRHVYRYFHILISLRTGPEWCSMNHGVLLCDECCSVHLSLGRHISQIKSFKRSYWPPTQLNVKTRLSMIVRLFSFISSQLIYELTSNGANLIWEYSLRDPQNKLPKKKPSAKDSLPYEIETKFFFNEFSSFFNRVKAEFIRAKYQQMAYINRLKDETNGTLEDLNLVIDTFDMCKLNVNLLFLSAITFDRSNR